MHITLKLFASLSVHLPSGARHNQVQVEVPEGATPKQIIEQFGIPSALTHLVLVDGVFVPVEERATKILVAGNELAIFPPVAGG